MHNLPMSTLNDIRFVLEVARAGSTLAASRGLRVSQSTVMRRIAAVERDLGVELFEKRSSGYVATAALQRLIAPLEAVEAAYRTFRSEADSLRNEATDKVRVTAPETVANLHLNKALALLRASNPSIEVEILATDKRVDLAAGEADIAVRAGFRPSDAGLYGRKIAEDRWSVFCSADYVRRNGMPATEADLSSHPFIDFKEGVHTGAMRDWLDRHVPRRNVVMRHNSFASILASVKAGLGVSYGSDFITLSDPDLVRCFTPDGGETYEIWLLAHERHRKTGRVKIVMDHLARYFAEMKAVRADSRG
jgi:DNA-binding transcriptional LysR family regulator